MQRNPDTINHGVFKKTMRYTKVAVSQTTQMLFGLPPELRIYIYEMVLEQDMPPAIDLHCFQHLGKNLWPVRVHQWQFEAPTRWYVLWPL